MSESSLLVRGAEAVVTELGITVQGGLEKRHEGRLLPVCACCGKQVDRMESMHVQSSSSYNYSYGHQVLFRVHCHGRMQTSILNESDARTGASASFGVAFLEEAACRAMGEGMAAVTDPGRRFTTGQELPGLPAPSASHGVIDCVGVEVVDDEPAGPGRGAARPRPALR